MVNFICQLDWVTGYLDISSEIILGMPVRVSWNKTHTEIGRLEKQDCILYVGGLHPVS